MIRRMIAAGGGAAMLALGLSAVPVFGADSGTVTATVVGSSSAVCVTVSPGSIDFGTVDFSPPEQASQASSQEIGISNCGSVPAQLLARGTDATAQDNAGVTWTLDESYQSCPASPVLDRYRLTLRDVAPVNPPLDLSTTNKQLLATLAPAATHSRVAAIRMPCVGSSGAGSTMSMSVVITAAST